MGTRTPLFVRKQSGGMFVVSDETEATGDKWFVDSGSATGADSTGYGQNPDSPFLTWDYAIGLTSENNGDRIFLMPGHAESIATAGGVALDKAGVTTIGIGEGADRPTFTFITSNNASITLSAASNTIKNIVLVSNKDGLVAPLAITGSDFDVDVEYRDTSSTVEAKKAITVSGGASRGKIKLKHIGFTAGDNQTQAVTISNGANIDINVEFYGKASTSVVDLITTASTDIRVKGYFYNDSAPLTKNVKDTITGSTWFVHGYDGKGGYPFSGGSASAVASDDVTATIAATGAMADAKNTAGVSSTVSVMSYVKEILDNTMGSNPNSLRDKKLTVTATLTSATWNAKASHEIATVSGQVRVRVLPVVTATGVSNAATCLIKLGTSGQTTAMVANTTAQFLTAGRIWNATTGLNKTISFSNIADKVVSGDDIGYTIGGKTASAGTIVFHIWWEPLVAGSTVTAGAGGVLA